MKTGKRNMALIGFMGVGKSTAGRVLAERTGRVFIETDALIEKKAGKTIPEIFCEDGEDAFRELEAQVVQEAGEGEKQVIACGGGVVLNRINIDRLKKGSVIVWLTASPRIILERTAKEEGTRPLLKDKDVADIEAFLESRRPLYEQAADYRVDTDNGDIGEIVERILIEVRE